jgi:hypothetical protein
MQRSRRELIPMADAKFTDTRIVVSRQTVWPRIHPVSKHRLHARRMDVPRPPRQLGAQGQLKWPWGAEPRANLFASAIDVAIKNRAVHFCGVSDMTEPYKLGAV